MNPALARLQPYPFERLEQLKAGITPPADRPHIALSIGEPKHPTPRRITEVLLEHLHTASSYPTTAGLPALREAICGWLCRRYSLDADSLDPDRNVLPVSGTREALFAAAQFLLDPAQDPLVVLPNPCYQIYEGATLLAGGRPHYLACLPATGQQPDFDSVPAKVWRHCALIYVCSPDNPTGGVLSQEQFIRLLELAEAHDFVIASDECYSEIYPEEGDPPAGLLQAAAAAGNDAYRRCLVFHSLSKRSNAPGLRSGFVAGDAELIGAFRRYRTYHGCTMPLYTQHASIAAWIDERHVVENRALYREKFDAVLGVLEGVLEVERPGGGFYLWPRTPVDDAEFARRLYASENVTVLPGSFMGREAQGGNPGAGHVRMALVAPLEECVEAALRIRRFVEGLG
ncbi:MAG: succinyldiaminopimelate transaminase [Gammaproteobacteria bacterium]|nr:MAG: succinyldiaminopimelate transaminase [Gammaproteobacteria bacterium]